MQVVLFRGKDSWLDKAIKFFTNTDYRHSAVILDEYGVDALRESSGSKGGVTISRRLKFRKGSCIRIFDLGALEGDNLRHITQVSLRHLEVTDYDFLGFFLWNLNRQSEKKMYCFEYTAFLLEKLEGDKFKPLRDNIELIKDGSISGQDLENVLVSLDFPYQDYKVLKDGTLKELLPEKVV